MTQLLKDLIQLSPIWSLSLMAFIPLSAKVLNNNKELKAGSVSGIYGLAIFSSLFLFVFLGFNDQEILGLRFDNYSSGACALSGFSALISLGLFHLNPWVDERQRTEILFFLSQGLTGLYVFCLAQDLMTAFIGLELASLSLYINLAMSRKDRLCLEASIKYFVLSALAGVVFLYGLSFLFGSAGTLDLKSIFQTENQALFYNRFFFLGWILIFTGLFFKTALFPFHFWLADVYQGALTYMTAFMAMAVKSALILFLGKIFAFSFFEKSGHGSVFLSGLAWASVLTVMFGNVMALKQKQIKRIVAFSSLAHSGYLMMALFGILSLSGSSKDFSALFYYLLAYISLTGGLLLGVQSLEKQNSQPQLKDLQSLFHSNPLFALALSVFLLGLAGMPPTFGFFAKIGIFQPLILSANWWVLLWAFVGSAIGLFYYIKPISLMAIPSSRSPVEWPRLAQALTLILALIGLLGAFFFGVLFY